ncbi:MAG: MBL fold metallo-hydrolase [Acidobacteriia bacterium]|nr:MBL fold metallo-hydrolase [Terriglobia bacterium]
MKCWRWLGIILLAAAPPLAAEELFELKPVADGVYAAIAKPATKVNCNGAVILLDDGVMLVDTFSKPSAARALMEQIKSVTPKPVKYVVDTHFHWDHYYGNEVYLGAWPAGVEIISSEATRQNIEQRGIPRVKREILEVPKEIETLKADLAKATDATKKAVIQENLRQTEAYLAELKAMRVTLPTLTFDRSLILYRQSRTVEILYLGKGHTDGDAVVYLPKEKVIITGDALHGWTPYMGDSYPYDWIRMLEATEKLDFDYIIGGHGGVMRGKGQFQMWEQYFRDLLAETAAAYAQGATLEETRQRVAAALVPKYTGKMPATFPQDVVGNIEKAYRVVSGATN